MDLFARPPAGFPDPVSEGIRQIFPLPPVQIICRIHGAADEGICDFNVVDRKEVGMSAVFIIFQSGEFPLR